MALIKYDIIDNLSAQLDGNITSGQTTITVKNGVNLPANGAGKWVLTIVKLNSDQSINKLEKVYATNKSGNVFTVIRGYDGTTATTFSDNDFIYLNVAAVVVKDLQDELVRLETAKANLSWWNTFSWNQIITWKVNISWNLWDSPFQLNNAFMSYAQNATAKNTKLMVNTYERSAGWATIDTTMGGWVFQMEGATVDTQSRANFRYRAAGAAANSSPSALISILWNGNFWVWTQDPSFWIDNQKGDYRVKDNSKYILHSWSSNSYYTQLYTWSLWDFSGNSFLFNMATPAGWGVAGYAFYNTDPARLFSIDARDGTLRSKWNLIFDSWCQVQIPIWANKYIFDVSGTQARLRTDAGTNRLWIWGFSGGITLNNATSIVWNLTAPDNTYTCGASGNRWSAIWAANGTIQTSDRRQKTDIIESTLWLNLIEKLTPVSYKWINWWNTLKTEIVEVEKEVQETQTVEYIEKSYKIEDWKYIEDIEVKTREELVFEQVDVYDENGNQIFDEIEVEETEEKETEIEKVEIIDGKAVIKKEKIKQTNTIYETFDLYDENGNQIFDEIEQEKIINLPSGEEVMTVEKVKVKRVIEKPKMVIKKVPKKVVIPKMVIKKIPEERQVLEEKPGKRTHFWFIAQEVEEAVKQVSEELGQEVDFWGLVVDEKGNYALRYDQLIAVLAQAVKELNEKVKILENK